jgi:acetylornithine aminotransferase/acetylornithine/N-succinyldiaminopimelate aminotransferase
MQQLEKSDPYSSLEADTIKRLEDDYLFSTYKRYDLIISRGTGARVYDIGGNAYLDFLAGIAVNSLGYNHPRIVRVLLEQGQRMIHCSNLFYHPYQGSLAKRLAGISGMSRVFFTNSGTEAIEGALKIARAYAHKHGQADKSIILTLKNSFHGRTLGALSITAQEKYQAPFRPLVPDVQILEQFTVGALEKAFTKRICALVLEPIQGEGGVVPVPEEFLKAARRLCDKYDALLILDEIQSGMGRTGKYFAFQHYGILPDLVTVAKSLAAGYPLGAILGAARVAESLQPGEHGTTFGGGPLACRLALEVLDIIDQDDLLRKVTELGEYLVQGLKRLAAHHKSMGEIRGAGLMIGVEMGPAAKTVVDRLLKRGVLANAAHETVLRLLPPFVITQGEIDEFLSSLDGVLDDVEAESSSAGLSR